MMIQSISFYACISNVKDTETQWYDQYCNKVGVTYMNCFIGLSLLTICEPLSILPYVLRSIRLYVIFKA